jgi:hypothetical protein
LTTTAAAAADKVAGLRATIPASKSLPGRACATKFSTTATATRTSYPTVSRVVVSSETAADSSLTAERRVSALR